MRRATIYGVQEVPRPRLEELGQFIQSRVAWLELLFMCKISDAVTDMLQAALQ
jgi:uncharacterized membrane protein YdjX (TVP38/TMEM64 family)